MTGTSGALKSEQTRQTNGWAIACLSLVTIMVYVLVAYLLVDAGSQAEFLKEPAGYLSLGLAFASVLLVLDWKSLCERWSETPVIGWLALISGVASLVLGVLSVWP